MYDVMCNDVMYLWFFGMTVNYFLLSLLIFSMYLYLCTIMRFMYKKSTCTKVTIVQYTLVCQDIAQPLPCM